MPRCHYLRGRHGCLSISVRKACLSNTICENNMPWYHYLQELIGCLSLSCEHSMSACHYLLEQHAICEDAMLACHYLLEEHAHLSLFVRIPCPGVTIWEEGMATYHYLGGQYAPLPLSWMACPPITICEDGMSYLWGPSTCQASPVRTTYTKKIFSFP